MVITKERTSNQEEDDKLDHYYTEMVQIIETKTLYKQKNKGQENNFKPVPWMANKEDSKFIS